MSSNLRNCFMKNGITPKYVFVPLDDLPHTISWKAVIYGTAIYMASLLKSSSRHWCSKILVLTFLNTYSAIVRGGLVNTRCKRICEAFWNCVWYANDCGTLFTEKMELRDGIHGRAWHDDQVGRRWAILWGIDTILCSHIDCGCWVPAQVLHYSQVGSFSCFCEQFLLK